MLPQPSEKSDRSYPVFGARPFTANLSSTDLAVGAAVWTWLTAWFAGLAEAEPVAKTIGSRRAAASADLENFFNLKKFDDCVDERIDLFFCITAPLRCEDNFAHLV